MTLPVTCTLVLEAADSTIDPYGPPTEPSAYPNRVLMIIPPQLHALASAVSGLHYVSGYNEAEFRGLASGLVETHLGSDWSVELYSSGSQEQNGGWSPASGYSYRMLSGSTPLTDTLTGVSSDCVCTYLVHLHPQT